jgi:hypothetical protein
VFLLCYSQFIIVNLSSYGEKGSVIIQKMLLELFATLDHTCINNIKPLSLPQFAQHILVPQVATLLIAADKRCSIDNAFKMMRDSGSYGYQQFVDVDDDPDYDAVQRECVRLARSRM